MIMSLVHIVLTFCNKTFSLIPFSADKLSSELSANAIHCSTWEWRKLFHVYLKNKSWKQTITATCIHKKSRRFNNEKSLNDCHISYINIFLYALRNLQLFQHIYYSDSTPEIHQRDWSHDNVQFVCGRCSVWISARTTAIPSFLMVFHSPSTKIPEYCDQAATDSFQIILHPTIWHYTAWSQAAS